MQSRVVVIAFSCMVIFAMFFMKMLSLPISLKKASAALANSSSITIYSICSGVACSKNGRRIFLGAVCRLLAAISSTSSSSEKTSISIFLPWMLMISPVSGLITLVYLLFLPKSRSAESVKFLLIRLEILLDTIS